MSGAVHQATMNIIEFSRWDRLALRCFVGARILSNVGTYLQMTHLMRSFTLDEYRAACGNGEHSASLFWRTERMSE